MSPKYFSVKPGYKVSVRNADENAGFFNSIGSLDSNFRLQLAGDIDYQDMRVYVTVDGAPGAWRMELSDWEQLVIPRRELDKKFIEELYDGSLPVPHLPLRS